MNSLLLPTLYLGGCITAMSIFSHFYRRWTSQMTVEPWFSENVEKEKYIALLNCESDVPEHQLRAALLRRAMEGVRRIIKIQQDKEALKRLMKMGSVGDDLSRDLAIAEREVTDELQEIAQEATTFKADWGKTIFQTAAQMIEHEHQKKIRDKMEILRKKEEAKAKADEEKRTKIAKAMQEELIRAEEDAVAAASTKKNNSKKK